MRYEIEPVPKPRQTRADKWRKRPCVLRYRAFADQVRAKGVKLESGDCVTFVLPMPKSWSKRKRQQMNGEPHKQRPDWDNLGKALSDAVHGEDCHLWDVRVRKLWGERGAIIVE